jgi:hypothetical protein
MPTQDLIQSIKDLAAVTTSLTAQATSDKQKLALVLSEINDLLHIIEYKELSASSMSKVSKKLKELYRERRVLKENLIMLENIFQNKKDPTAELKNSEGRLAKYRSEAEAAYTRIFASPPPENNPQSILPL